MKKLILIPIAILLLGGTMWYTQAMGWAKDNKIMNDGRPNDYITRAEVAQMLYNYDKKDSITDQKYKIVTVESGNNVGAGIIIKENIIITSFHNLEGDVYIQFYNAPTRTKVEVLKTSQSEDIAVLGTYTKEPVEIAESYKDGNEVFIIGSPVGIRHFIAYGVIGRGNLLDASINPGHSGGGVFNTSGELIGMVSYKFTDVEGIGAFIPVKKLLEFVEDI